jgi:hypothetical protein
MVGIMTKDQCVRIYEKACVASAHDKNMVLEDKYFDEPIREESLTHDKIKEAISELLLETIDTNDADFVESALGLIGRVGEPDNWFEILCKLVLDINHNRHEDIVGFLQHCQDPSSVPILKKAILLKPKLEYIEYDDYGSYYKKCLWALQDIGTDEAILVIRDCAKSADFALKEQAEYRLSKIKHRP